MLSFKQFCYLIEALVDDLKNSNPEHADVIDHLHALDHTPTKRYLKPLVKMHVTGNLPDPYENADHISNTIKAFDRHAVKLNNKDFGQYRSFDQVSSALEPHMAKDRAKKDIDVVHNNPETGVRIQQMNSKDACIQNYGGGKTNWCIAATGKGNLFDNYSDGGKNKVITIHHDNSETGEKNLYVYHQAEGELKGPKQDRVFKPDELHPDVQKALEATDHHPVVSELNWQHPDLLDQKLDKAVKNKENIPRKTQNYIMINKDASYANKVIDAVGNKLHPNAQDSAMTHLDPSITQRVIKTMGEQLNSEAQQTAMERDDASLFAHKLIDTVGSKLHPTAQQSAMLHKDPTVSERVISTMGRYLHPDAQVVAIRHGSGQTVDNLLNSMKDELHPDAQTFAMERRDPEFRKKIIDSMGDKLHPDAQKIAMYYRDAHKVIDIMGDKLHPDAQTEAIMSDYSPTQNKVIEKLGPRLHPDAQQAAMGEGNLPLTQKITKILGRTISPSAQRTSILSTNPEVAHHIVDHMGDELHPDAQSEAMSHRDPTLAQKVIQNMGDKLHPTAQLAALAHPDPAVSGAVKF